MLSTGTKDCGDSMTLSLCRSDTDKDNRSMCKLFANNFFLDIIICFCRYRFRFDLTPNIDVTHSDSINAINMTGRVLTLIVRKRQLQLLAFSISNF